MLQSKRFPLVIILSAYLLLGVLFAVYTPDWQAPDEPAHYNYVRQLAAGHLPVMELGDYDEAYKNEAIGSGFAPEYDVSLITYEDWQPPLYYLLLTPVFWLTGGSLLALRLVSVLLGAGLVALAYAVAGRLFPERREVAVGTAVFAAFLPQHLSILASVNNDALAELLIAGILFLLVGIGDWRLEIGKGRALLLGVLLGLGFLTKGTVYSLTAVIAAALLWRYWGKWRDLVQAGLWVFVPAFLLGTLWWGRNLALYGGLDVLGKAAHDAVVVGQPRTADLVAEVGLASAMWQLVQTTFHSFWGQFGWMALPMLNPGWVYPLLWAFTAVAISGLLLHFFQNRRQSPISNLQSLILMLLFLLTLGVHVVYNITFIQHQGRYLFPALIPIGIGVAVGVGGWIRPLQTRWPILLQLWPWGLALALVGLDVWALFRVIVPNL
ncbi:MAG: DUF2142 domain-containing protein [Ardenticatenaceae bacterium]|nr:DUF2142 domain-containing protein [Anaerolineales bacterium]MCB8922243.1 DUF2142 domain-containing protein [Ardenticatenaceae bacterium]MCB8990572.1 DUF2142 domain-containing protein [Ardenticatenaceae bacterium]